MNPGCNPGTGVRVWWHWNVMGGYWRWAGEEGLKVLIWSSRAVIFLIKKVVWVLAVITCLSTGILRTKIYFRAYFFRWADLAWWKLRVVRLYRNPSSAPDTCTPNLLLTAVGMIKLVMETFVLFQGWYVCMKNPQKHVIHRYFCFTLLYIWKKSSVVSLNR